MFSLVKSTLCGRPKFATLNCNLDWLGRRLGCRLGNRLGNRLDVVWASFGRRSDVVWASFGSRLGVVWAYDISLLAVAKQSQNKNILNEVTTIVYK